MTREEFLKQLMVKKFGNVKSFAEYVDIPYTTIRSILERGVGKAGVDNVIKICRGLGISPETLTDDFKISETVANTLNTLVRLEEDRQDKVYTYAEKQLNEQNGVADLDKHRQNKKIVNGRSTAAGFPIDGDAEDKEASIMIVDQTEIPSNADEIVTIAGDSMEPDYPKGSQVFIHYQPEVENGEVAIVSIVDEGVTCKKVYYDFEKGNIILESINEEYKDMVYPMDEIRVIGKVL
ncbi:XRE family transcriptional regulator [Enterococcus larvae]|uniref:XRE family transcriptional regulator n=1 Tax=Enterococcus larvae TaxID=2794352 RepID=UPI003F2A0CF1